MAYNMKPRRFEGFEDERFNKSPKYLNDNYIFSNDVKEFKYDGAGRIIINDHYSMDIEHVRQIMYEVERKRIEKARLYESEHSLKSKYNQSNYGDDDINSLKQQFFELGRKINNLENKNSNQSHNNQSYGNDISNDDLSYLYGDNDF